MIFFFCSEYHFFLYRSFSYRSFCSDIGGNKLGLRIVVEGVAYSCKKDADIDVEGRTG